MKEQAKQKGSITNSAIGGKTGTPERSYKDYKLVEVVDEGGKTDKKPNSKREVTSSKNDAWYIFFVDEEGVNQAKAGKLAVAVRVERANATSSLAMQLSRDLIIPVLRANEYIK